MTEYEAQAKQFLADCNATIETRFIGKDVPLHWLSETKPHNKYQFTITTPKGKYTSYFWDSLRNTKANAIPTEYDILSCVEKYSYDSFSDFCSEFGYSTDSISTRETFLACDEEYAGLRRIFTEEQMEKMRAIY